MIFLLCHYNQEKKRLCTPQPELPVLLATFSVVAVKHFHGGSRRWVEDESAGRNSAEVRHDLNRMVGSVTSEQPERSMPCLSISI